MSTSAELSEERRREIFAALVAAQDRGVPVAESRREVAEQFSVTADAMSQIEREGMDNQWPPLA
jgi:hypothetical protein